MRKQKRWKQQKTSDTILFIVKFAGNMAIEYI